MIKSKESQFAECCFREDYASRENKIARADARALNKKKKSSLTSVEFHLFSSIMSIYSWGTSKNGETGSGEFEDVLDPAPMEHLKVYSK